MNLSNVMNVFKREAAAYFNAAIAYIFIIVFVLIAGGLFMTQFFIIGLAEMRPFFLMLPYILAVFMPAVTMRLWAEEKRGNTLELLLTFPMKTQEIVLGKFLASLLFYIAALVGTLTIPVMLEVLGNPDTGMMVGGYIGAVLLGAFYLAVGIFISGFCRDQIVAFILAMMICFGLHLVGTDFMASSIDSWLPGFGSFLSEFLGTTKHFESFAKGVLDVRDTLYFLIGIVIFLSLNAFWLEGRMKPSSKKIFTVAAILSIGIFLSGNWLLSSFSLGRFDLTEGKIYTTSDATRRIFKELKAPVLAKFYVSRADKMPTGMKTLEQDVLDKLDELRVASNGTFQYKVFHMEAANVTEQRAEGAEESMEEQLEKKGIQPYQVRAIESDEVQVRLVYSALTLAYKEKAEEMIPRITPDNLHELEYRLVSKVYRMTLPSTPGVTIVAPYEEKQLDPQMASILAQLGGKMPEGYRDDKYELLDLALQYEGYTVTRIKSLSEKEPIAPETKTLVVMEPKELNERQRYELNRFVLGGGSLLLAVQEYMYGYDMSGRDLTVNPEKQNPGVNALLAEWGFEVDDNILVDEQHDVINLGGAKMGPFDMAVPVKVPIQILITQTGMNSNVSITSRLSPLFYLWGTALKLNDAKITQNNLKVETLLSSTKDSWTVPAPPGALTPQSLTKQPESKNGPLPLAIMVQGQFPDAFKDKAVPAWPVEGPIDASQPPPAAPETPGAVTPAPGKLILIGAATPFQKHMLKSGGHLNLFVNSVDALTLGDELITIRSKQPIDRSLGRVSTPSKIAWRAFVTLIIPALIAAIGFLRALIRRQAKQHYLKQYAAV